MTANKSSVAKRGIDLPRDSQLSKSKAVSQSTVDRAVTRARR
jgi:hypothetical protein